MLFSKYLVRRATLLAESGLVQSTKFSLSQLPGLLADFSAVAHYLGVPLSHALSIHLLSFLS